MATKKLPVLGDQPIEVKQTRSTTNTIAFSSDMDMLFVIDDGKVLPFNLLHPNGVIVGTLRGQVVAGTAVSVPADNDVQQKVTISLQKAHWTVFYRRPVQTLNVIGATDIDLSFTGDTEIKAQAFRLSLAGAPIHVRRSGNFITFSVLKA